MRRFAGLAVMGIMLVLASPAAAQDRSVEGGEVNSQGATPVQSRHRALATQAINADPQGFVAEQYPSGPRMFGSLPVADNVRVGVGLFSVLGSTEKEQLRRRMDPARAFLPADTRVAAVGFSLRF
jgi:hypothetical protein